VRLWDTESGEELKRFEDKDIFWFSASLAGDRILLCTKNAVLLDGELNQIRTFRNMTDPDSAMLSPNGKWAAIAIGRTIGLWDTETGEEIRTIRGLDRISSMAFNDDSSQLVSYDGSIRIWDLETGEKTVEVVRNLWVYRLAFVPGTDLVLSVDAQRMTLWDDSGRITTGNDSTSKEIGEYDANTLILSIMFNNDGTQFLLGMVDGTVMLWDASIWH
jgi:WD40 repeat protein